MTQRYTPPTNDSSDEAKRDGFVLPRSDYNVAPPTREANPAADVIRDKLAKIYASEPDALQEEREAEVVPHRSTHQQFIYDLNHSGKTLAQIQTEWHNYYISLPDNEKHVVWQEFYNSNELTRQPTPQLPSDTPTDAEKMATMRSQLASHGSSAKSPRKSDNRKLTEIQTAVRKKVTRPSKLRAKQHVQSLIFGLGVGVVTLIVFLFGFFNEMIIAPFIQPARSSAATPLIINSNTVAPSPDPQVIIPKINVQIPIRFDAVSTSEESMQKELESGVAHYPTTSMPGQNGNGAYFGHSSNNIFNKGAYKFAFVLLHQLVPGDTFYITKDSKVYAYKVFSKTVVEPNQVEVLNPIDGHDAIATLITCDPPGTSLRRLVIHGDQISPDPVTNTAAATPDPMTVANTATLAGNSPTLWHRFISQDINKIILVLVVVAFIIWIFRGPASRKKSAN